MKKVLLVTREIGDTFRFGIQWACKACKEEVLLTTAITGWGMEEEFMKESFDLVVVDIHLMDLQLEDLQSQETVEGESLIFSLISSVQKRNIPLIVVSACLDFLAPERWRRKGRRTVGEVLSQIFNVPPQMMIPMPYSLEEVTRVIKGIFCK